MTVVELAHLITKYNLEEKGYDTLYFTVKKLEYLVRINLNMVFGLLFSNSQTIIGM